MSYIKVILWGPDGIIKEYEALKGTTPGLTAKMPLTGTLNVELIDGSTQLAPQVVALKRQGKNLAVALEGDSITSPAILLENFYDRAETHLMGEAQDGLYYEFVPTTGEVQDFTPLLKEGALAELALGGSGSPEASPATDESHSQQAGFTWLPYVAWLAAAGAVIGIVSLLKSHSHDDKSAAKPVNEPDTADREEYAEISGGSNVPQSVITVELPDGTRLTTQTDAEGNWRIEAPYSQPKGKITVTVTTEEGHTTTVSGDYKKTAEIHDAHSVDAVRMNEPLTMSSADHNGLPGDKGLEVEKEVNLLQFVLEEIAAEAIDKEVINPVNNSDQTLAFALAGILDSDDRSVEDILKTTDDTVNTEPCPGTTESLQTDNGADYVVYFNNEGTVPELWIQQDLTVY